MEVPVDRIVQTVKIIVKPLSLEGHSVHGAGKVSVMVVTSLGRLSSDDRADLCYDSHHLRIWDSHESRPILATKLGKEYETRESSVFAYHFQRGW